MEMLEMELIKKLQNTQAIQKQAYVELEEAINTRPVLTMGGNAAFRHQAHGDLNGSGSNNGMDNDNK